MGTLGTKGGDPSRKRPAGLVLGLALVAVASLGWPQSAQAVPSFSDQTGDPCGACHVGAFGPQLTAHGRQFKLTGYSDGDKVRKLPLLSSMVQWSFTDTAKGVPGGAAPGFRANDNPAFDQVSIFVAGRIYDHLGIFSQNTWDGIANHWSWDQTDLRYGREVEVGGIDTILGVSLNNAPTVSDPYNTTPVWGFPYAASGLAPSPGAVTLIEDGLGQRVVGATVYGLINDMIYVEAGGYHVLPRLERHNVFGVFPADGPIVDGLAPYWRVAYQNESPAHSFHVGTFGMAADVFPDNDHSAGTNRFIDVGIDTSYQWHPSKRHVLTVGGSAIFEEATLSASRRIDGTKSSETLNSFKINGSYYYDQTYGLSLGVFKTTGSRDKVLYSDANITGRPDSTGYVVQVDWTPFGKEDSWMAPWANLRMALQYTGYTQFNGRSSNYDGSGRTAADNNTLWLLTWMAF